MILNVPLSLSATEQSTLSASPVSKTTLLPASNSKLEPTGIGTSFARNDVPFVTLFPPPLLPVVLTSSSSADTCAV